MKFVTGSNVINLMIGDNVTKEKWRKETNKVIADNLVQNISSLLDAKVIRQTTLNSRGESTRRIIFEYDYEGSN
jgi:hypothetical protein